MDFKQQLNEFNQKVNAFVQFIINKLKNFKNLTLGEQISFGVIGGGLFLILVSFVLFLI
jgi:hypothetical protein